MARRKNIRRGQRINTSKSVTAWIPSQSEMEYFPNFDPSRRTNARLRRVIPEDEDNDKLEE